MNYNELRKEWVRLKKEFDLNPTKEIYDEIEKVDKEIKELYRSVLVKHTPRGNYGDKKEN